MMDAPVVIPLVDEGLGNSSYLVELGDHQALAVDASLDPRALRAETERRDLRVLGDLPVDLLDLLGQLLSVKCAHL